jgi:hypothetical protein
MKLTKSRRSYRAACIATIVVTAVAAARTANAEPRRVQIGTLTCSLSSSIGLVIGSQRNVSACSGECRANRMSLIRGR